MIVEDVESPRNKRISSIDSLRSLVLFGILLVHTSGGFHVELINPIQSFVDELCIGGISNLLCNKCSLIFSILFGVSFYIILRKPDYPSSRFVWRCFLLMCLGLLNKFFYSSDALMWYGICGMVLVIFRNLSTRKILFSYFSLLIISSFISQYRIGDLLEPYMSSIDRYGPNPSFTTVVQYYPSSILHSVRRILNDGVFYTLANFCLGYYFGKIGIVDRMDSLVKKKHVLLSGVLYMILYALIHILHASHSFLFILFFRFYYISGALFYAIIVIYLYNNTKTISKLLRSLEPYGRLGLTNYTSFNVIGVLLLCHLGYGFVGYRMIVLLLSAVLFYFLQAIFSRCWLHYFKNGPLEYAWRCLTVLKLLPMKK